MRRLTRALIYAGTLVVVVAIGRYHARYVGGYDYVDSSRFAWALAYAGLLSFGAYGAGLPDLAGGTLRSLVLGLKATIAAAMGMSLVQLFLGSALLPRLVVFGAPLILIPWYALCSAIAARRARREPRERVVAVVGAEADLTLDVFHNPERPASIVEVIRPEEAVSAGWGDQPLVDVVREARATMVVLDRFAQAHDDVIHQASALHESGVRVRTLTLFYDEWLGKMPLPELERVSLMFDIGEIHRAGGYGRIKRVEDVTFGVVGGCMFALLVPLVVLGNLIANRGPLFYRQRRVGREGRVFEMLKFRTMQASDGDEGSWTSHEDPRITTFGKVLRRSHLDELPQVVNVLRGDLSIVGPRPEQPAYVETLTEKIAYYNMRHAVRPGLTGWAQVKYSYGASEIDAFEKLQYDFYYLRHQSLALDLRIIGRTVRTVFRQEGR